MTNSQYQQGAARQSASVRYAGTLGSDPKMKYTQSGKAILNFSIAVDVPGSDRPTWLNFVAWEDWAEWGNEQLKKGTTVFIYGRGPHTRQYTSRDGEAKEWTDYTADEIHIIPAPQTRERRQEAVEAPPPQPQPAPAQPFAGPAKPKGPISQPVAAEPRRGRPAPVSAYEDDDELPF